MLLWLNDSLCRMKTCFFSHFCCCLVLLQHGADPNIRNTDGKSALDLADPSAKAVLTGQYLNSNLLYCHTSRFIVFHVRSYFVISALGIHTNEGFRTGVNVSVWLLAANLLALLAIINRQ